MNWVKYLNDNYQLHDPGDLVEIARVADLAALSLQFKFGWYNYSLACSENLLHFMYSTKDGLFSAMIPLEEIAKRMVIKPLLEEIVEKHQKLSIPSYRKS